MADSVHSQLAELSSSTVSPAYITDRAEFEEYVRRDDRTLLVYVDVDGVEQELVEVTDPADLDRTDREVLAFSLLGRYDRDDFDAIISVPVRRVLAETPLRDDDFPVSFVKVIAVRPDQQGRGIGSRVSTEVASRVIAEPPAATMVWLRDNPANRKLAAAYSEFVMARFEDYFPPDWACPECGHDADCDCTVEMYGWFTDGRDERTGQAVPADD
ncbi:hypothetical protein [Halosegnis marinus]|uniref:N-acetyltransferase domain-containing protein n=1 Tax=Halosegnis marinus TaxID=3034023 RepID=A0ABD5ZLQ3_9EURY|nr:hypothetical protein [Halosegnis sp. DT85]